MISNKRRHHSGYLLPGGLVPVFLFLFCGISASASNFSFQGTFPQDNTVQLFNFALLSPGTVTLQTFGYGGGTNANGDTILAGGFESVLQVYNALGTAIGGTLLPGPDPTCSPRTPDPARSNFCQDVFGQISLATGNYILALTQNANLPNGDLSDGFFYVDIVPDPTFNKGFHGSFGLPGNGNFAVDIVGVDSASPVGSVPEPGSMLLGFTALLALGLRARRLASTNSNHSLT